MKNDMFSTDTYDVIDNALVFEVVDIATTTGHLDFITPEHTHQLEANNFYRFSVASDGTYLLEKSSDGSSWSSSYSGSTSYPELYRSMRVHFSIVRTHPTTGTHGDIGSINVFPEPKNTGAFLQFFLP